jgi:hypothetical protein
LLYRKRDTGILEGGIGSDLSREREMEREGEVGRRD